jgi:hypothetical protein
MRLYHKVLAGANNGDIRLSKSNQRWNLTYAIINVVLLVTWIILIIIDTYRGTFYAQSYAAPVVGILVICFFFYGWLTTSTLKKNDNALTGSRYETLKKVKHLQTILSN